MRHTRSGLDSNLPDTKYAFIIIWVCIAILFGVGIAAFQETPVVTSPYWVPPDMVWTRSGRVRCIAWAVPHDRYYYHCDNGTSGIEASGTLFQDLKHSP